MANRNIRLVDISKKGGEATKNRYGRSHYLEMQKKSWTAQVRKDKDAGRKFSSLGVEARRKKAKEKKSGLSQFADLVVGEQLKNTP